ncbi:MAG: isoaspartyl peptidase/L-asparaginase family protein [Actinomycetota bacterium]
MPQLLVHGGVSGKPLLRMPEIDHALMVPNGGAVDLVEEAVRRLEDDPALNAGWGAVLDRDGRLELDAGIADGHRDRCAGVANVTVRHPISLARRVMEETPHVLLTGAGAQAFAGDMETLGSSTPEQQSRWSDASEAGRLDLESFGSAEHVDTVGAIALDDSGALAAGSSTGGVFGKMPGRVGDAPIFGAGIYASAHVAVMGTGVGELFLATLASQRVGMMVEAGAHPQKACEEVIAYLGTRAGLPAGLLAIDSQGREGAAFRGGSLPVASSSGKVRPVRLS